jgi:hypothetical protein
MVIRWWSESQFPLVLGLQHAADGGQQVRVDTREVHGRRPAARPAAARRFRAIGSAPAKPGQDAM